MDYLRKNLDAMKLAERLHSARREEYWLHLEAEGALEKYPAKQHARRVRDRLDVAEGLVYLPGAPARSNEDSDMPAPFRQRRYFYYLSGCNEASCHLAYDIRRDILTLFIPRVNPDRVFWNGRGSTPAEALDKYDIDEVFYVDQLESWIQDWFLHYRYDGSQRLYVLHKEQIPQSRFPWPVDSISLQPAVDQCRMIKDEHEIKLIRKANDISSKAHKQVLANITKFKNEAQVEGLFLNVCIANQAKQQAYDPIAASGPNAGTLHYGANNEDFGDRQLMCLDAGCEFDLYASDITRTFPLSGSWPSKEAENIYKLVERMQDTCIQGLAPGVRYLDLHILAHQIAIDGLLKLGILHNGTREEIYKAGTSKAFFPHGLGHHVGLEVHDVGQRELMSLYKNPNYEKVPSLYPQDFHLPVYDKDLCMAPTLPQSPHLEEGMVVTVEPGIYFSEYVLNYFYLPSPVHSKYINKEVLYRYFPVGGVRIEDDLLITSKGYENLSTAPKGDAMFEIMRNQSSRAPSKLIAKKDNTVEEPLRRAPGIPKRVVDPALKPISRAATEPLKNVSARAIPEEKHAFQDHWLFRESQISPPFTGNDYKGKAFQTEQHKSVASQPDHLPLCGNLTQGVEHIFLGWQNEPGQRACPSYLGIGTKRVEKCPQCIVLSETVERLRKTLSRSTKNSPRTSPKPETGTFEGTDHFRTMVDDVRPLVKTLGNGLPSEGRKVPEMRQITRLPPKSSTDKTHSQISLMRLHDPLRHDVYDDASFVPTKSCPEAAPRISGPSSFGIQRGVETEIRSNRVDNVALPPQAKPQRRSVTFDSYPTTQPQQPLARQEKIPAPSDRYADTTGLKIFDPNDTGLPSSMYTYPIPSASTYPEPLPPLEARTSGVRDTIPWRDAPALRGHPAASERRYEHEQHMYPTDPQRYPSARPSLPALPQGQPGEVPLSRDLPAASRIRHSMFVPADASTQQQELRRIRSMGSTLVPSRPSNSIPQPQHTFSTNPRMAPPAVSSNPHVNSRAEYVPYQPQIQHTRTQMHRYEHPGPTSRRSNMAMNETYSRSRPGGEELGGIDYATW